VLTKLSQCSPLTELKEKDDRRTSTDSSGLSDVPSNLSGQSPSNQVRDITFRTLFAPAKSLTHDIECIHVIQQGFDVPKARRNRGERWIRRRIQATPQKGHSWRRAEGSQKHEEGISNQDKAGEEDRSVNKFGGVACGYLQTICETRGEAGDEEVVVCRFSLLGRVGENGLASEYPFNYGV
jgi:hypothetical protein